MEDMKGINLDIISQVVDKVSTLRMNEDFKLVKTEIKSYSVYASFRYRDKVSPTENIDIEFEVPKHYAQGSSSIDTIRNIESICRAVNFEFGYILEELNIKKRSITSTFKNYNDYTIIKVKIPRDF